MNAPLGWTPKGRAYVRLMSQLKDEVVENMSRRQDADRADKMRIERLERRALRELYRESEA